MVSPALLKVVVFELLVVVIEGADEAVTTAVDGLVMSAPVGGVSTAVAVLLMVPAFTSSWVAL